MSITVPGDHNRTVGEIINLKLPSNYFPTEEHTFYTGNYLITKVQHLVTHDNTFTTTFELIKDSLHHELVKSAGVLDEEIENFVSDDPEEDFEESGR